MPLAKITLSCIYMNNIIHALIVIVKTKFNKAALPIKLFKDGCNFFDDAS